MEYITITSDSYESAVNEAKIKYGERVRIHSRKDYTVGGGLFAKKRNKCEIVCYLAPEKAVASENAVTKEDLKEFEKEARTPDPSSLSLEEKLETNLRKNEGEKSRLVNSLLDENDIKGPFRDLVLLDFDYSVSDIPLELSDRIISNVSIDHLSQAHPRKYIVFLGPTGSGKTTTLAKIGSLYKNVGKSVAIITLDSYRVGAYEQAKAFGDAFDIPVLLVKDEDEVILAQEKLRSYDLILVDTMGISPEDGALNLKLKGLLSLFKANETSFILTLAANLKSGDMMKQYKSYSAFTISSLIVTKLDETESIGSFLTFAYESGKPISFATCGQKVPQDLKKASTTVVLEYLKGFGIDVKRLAAQLLN